jgi:hypothetical protein
LTPDLKEAVEAAANHVLYRRQAAEHGIQVGTRDPCIGYVFTEVRVQSSIDSDHTSDPHQAFLGEELRIRVGFDFLKPIFRLKVEQLPRLIVGEIPFRRDDEETSETCGAETQTLALQAKVCRGPQTVVGDWDPIIHFISFS